MTEVVVLGAGALGSIYGAAFADAGCDVTLLARPPHAEAIRRDGLVIRSMSGERIVGLEAVSDPRSLPPRPDIALVAAKAHDVPGLVRESAIRPHRAFSVQNGVDKDRPLAEAFGPDHVIGCVSMVGGTLHGPGVVAHTMAGTTYLGAEPSGRDEIAELLTAGGLSAEVRPDIRSVEWSKAVLAVAAMGVTGLTRLRYHRVFLDPDARDLFLDLVDEAASVAAAEGVTLVDLPGPLQIATLASAGRSEARAVMERVGEAMVAAGSTEIRVSTLQSIESGRRTEVDAIHGRVLELADEHGIDLPVTRTVARVLRAVDAEIAGDDVRRETSDVRPERTTW